MDDRLSRQRPKSTQHSLPPKHTDGFEELRDGAFDCSTMLREYLSYKSAATRAREHRISPRSFQLRDGRREAAQALDAESAIASVLMGDWLRQWPFVQTGS